MVRQWRSRIFHEPCSDGRARDVLPLPLLEDVASVQGDVCRAVRRRILRKSAVVKMVNRAIFSLNSLYMGRHWDEGRCIAKLAELPLSQQECIRDLIRRVDAFGPMPSGASRRGALEALRAPCNGYSEPIAGVGEVANMNLELLSLPSGRVAGVNLSSALEQPLKDMVDSFEDWMLQDASTWSSICEHAHKIKPYNDPSLSDRSKYLSFLAHLNECGILSHTTSCRGRVGAFCVTKKPKEVNGKFVERQRLILDCRQVNLAFREPPKCELGSLAALCEVELKDGERLFCGGSDIQDCFYAAKISAELSNFFCLCHDLSPDEARFVWGDDFPFPSNRSSVSPCINVLPMGFSWSFFLIQKLHEQSALRSLGVGRDRLILDGYPAPVLSRDDAVAMPYCDNVHSLSLSRTAADDSLQRMEDDLEGMGFSLHAQVSSTDFFQTLGGIVDGGTGQIRATPTRAWNILLGFEEALVSKVNWQFIQKLLGHAMTLCVLNRAGMSVFRALYDFVERAEQPRFLNKLERREVKIFIGLVSLLVVELRRTWSSTIHCSDASPEGYGICKRELPESDVRELGSWQDRWRFKHLDPAEWRPRQRYAGQDVLGDLRTARSFPISSTVEDLYSYNNNFPEVPEEYTKPEDWSTVLMGRWRNTKEHITAKEGHSLVLVARHLCRSVRNRNKRHLVLIDSFALSMTMCKGRATNFGMLRTAQKVAALSLAGGFTLRTRWVPSEHNVADGPSRGQIQPGPYSKQFIQGSRLRTEAEACAERGETGEEFPGQSSILAEPSCCGEQEGALFEKDPEWHHSQEHATNEETEEEPAGSGWADSRGERLSSSQRTQPTGEKVGFKGGRESVRHPLREVQSLLPGFRSGTTSRLSVGLIADRLSGSHLFGRASCSRRRKNYGKCRVPSPQSERKPPSHSKGSERLAQGSASPESSSHAHVAGVWSCHGLNESQPKRNGSESHPGLRHIYASGREHRPEEQALGQAGEGSRSPVSMAFHHCERLRRETARQSGVFDNTIALNSADRIWIGDVISTMMKGKDKEAKIFSFSMEEFRKQFGEVSKILGIPGLHPYQLRHGGAAHDLASKARDHAQVKARGRWSTDQSVRRYTKTGKIQTLLGQLSKGSLEYCRWSQRNLKSVMSGRMQPKRL